VREHAFEGVLPNWSGAYRETDSVVVREDSPSSAAQPCPSAAARLAARGAHVKIADGRLHEDFPLPLASRNFSSLRLAGAKQQIAERIVREIA
jgi:excinuclease ABC subunit A